ncbi:MAG: hypothetical protein J6K58_14145 [Lachnospiraceae bacterium]|nr:hypothetical protein [Lachnospiraceae bacterium]
MKLLIAFMLVMFIMSSPYLRIIIFNLPFVLFYLPLDIFKYFRYKKWRNLATGKIWCYCSPKFGGGKTLSGTEYIESLFNTYNDRIVWDFSRRKFVTQKVRVVSNVAFNNIPFEDLKSLSQICNAAKECKILDEQNNTLTCSVFFIDEASSELNSRSFKDNLNPLVMKDIVTCRHNHISVILTSQDFKLIDALMRTVTSRVIYVFKTWRLCVHYFYDPKELENAGSYRLIRPVGKGGFFVRDKNYNAYDTLANVAKLNKKIEDGDILTEEEILNNLGNNNTDTSAILSPSRKLRRSWKKSMKK